MSIYDNIYNIINTYIYGGDIVEGTFEELVAVLMSTCACTFAVALPFIAIFGALRFIMSLGSR